MSIASGYYFQTVTKNQTNTIERLQWPRNMHAPPVVLVWKTLHYWCGDDNAGGAVANKVIAILIYEVYIPHPNHQVTRYSAAKAFGYDEQTYKTHYKKYGQRPYLRLVADRVLESIKAQMRREQDDG